MVLLRQNLDLIALRYEIPKAEADILTAGLRSNPILFADGQLIPYGRYTNDKASNPPQYDVNVTIPLDVSGKRRARLAVARQAKRVTEAQLQDAVRNLIDNLYADFLAVLAARESLRYNQAFRDELGREQNDAEARFQRGEIKDRDTLDDIRADLEQGRFEVNQASQTLARATRSLALRLNVPPSQAESIRVRGLLREVRPLPAPPEELIRVALECRPDLVAYRLAIGRARADVQLAQANRFADIYMVYQPYTYMSGQYEGLRSSYAYALGINAARTVVQPQSGQHPPGRVECRPGPHELASRERRVAFEVDEAIREFLRSQAGVLQLEREVLPRARLARDNAYGQYRQDETKVGDYLDEQQDYSEAIQQYRDALLEHRDSQFQLNTAVGARLLP